MSVSSRELDRIMRQPPTPFSEGRAFARALERQRRETQARLRAKRGGPVEFSVKV